MAVSKQRFRRFSAHAFQWQYNSTQPGSWTPVINTNQTMSWTDEVTHEGSVPDYRYRIAAGYDATTSFTGTSRRVRHVPGYIFRRFTRTTDGADILYEHRGYMNYDREWPTTAAWSSDADTAAMIEFVQAARNAQTHIQGGVFLGELAQTLRMIRRPAQALRRGIGDYLRTLRKRRKGSPTQRRRILAQTWLEYSYGWQPLLNDIDDAARYLANSPYLVRQVVPVRGKAVRKTRDSYSIRASNFSANADYSIEKFIERSHIVIYRGAVYCQVDNPVYMRAEHLGFNLRSFVPTLWELLPWSFLVDYFTNIGDVLSVWSFPSSNFAWKNRTVVSVDNLIQRTCNPTYSTQPSTMKEIGRTYIAGSVEAELRTVQRARHEGPLIPNLGFRVPGVGSLKWLNLAALATQYSRLRPY